MRTIGVPEAVAFADIDRRLLRNLAGLCVVTIVAVGAAWFGARLFILRQVERFWSLRPANSRREISALVLA